MKNIISSAVILSETKNPVVNISDDKISPGGDRNKKAFNSSIVAAEQRSAFYFC